MYKKRKKNISKIVFLRTCLPKNSEEFQLDGLVSQFVTYEYHNFYPVSACLKAV